MAMGGDSLAHGPGRSGGHTQRVTNLTLSLMVGWVVDVAARLPVRLEPIGAVARTVTTTLTLNLAPGARTGVSYVPALIPRVMSWPAGSKYRTANLVVDAVPRRRRASAKAASFWTFTK